MKVDANEFSVVLIVDEVTTEKIQGIRRELPPSPVREDPPHVTLLRGISSSDYKTDDYLLEAIAPRLEPFLRTKPSAVLGILHTIGSQLYGDTSAFEVAMPEVISQYRQGLIDYLISSDFMVEQRELESYRPHLTVTLGVAFPEDKDFSSILKTGETIEFVSFALLRTQRRQADGPRLVRVVRPSV